jgi:hypothetical protein
MTRVEDRICVIELEAILAATQTELAMTTAALKEAQQAVVILEMIDKLRGCKDGAAFVGRIILEALNKADEARDQHDKENE